MQAERFSEEIVVFGEREHSVNIFVSVMLCLSMLASVLVFAPAAGAADLPPSDSTITGTVTDGVDPIEGAYVKSLMMMAEGIEVSSAFTDASGVYSMGVPGDFDYMVLALHEDYYFSMGSASVGPSETVTLDFTMTAIAEDKDVTIKGFVLDESSDPVLVGNVIGFSIDDIGMTDMPKYGNITQVDTSGYFEMTIIPSDLGGGAILMDMPGYNMVGNETTSPLVSGETYWFNITLAPATYSDDASVYGVVMDSYGTPLPGALVSVRCSNMYLSESYNNYTFTDGSGNYMINITNGSVELTFTESGYTSVQMNLEIASGENCEVNAGLNGLTGYMMGNVTDLSTGLGIPNARVYQMYGVSDLRYFSMATTDSTGAYELRTWPADGDNSAVGAEADGYSRIGTQMNVSGTFTTWMDFGLWPVNSVLTGEVTDDMTGLPIAGVGVYVHSSTFENYVNTNETGVYSMPIVAGTHTVDIWGSGDYKPYSGEVDVPEYSTVVYDVSLVPYLNAVIDGYVIDFFTGEPVVGATVEVWGPSWNSTTTDLSGYYYLDVTDGTFWMSVSAPDYENYNTEVDVAEYDYVTLYVEIVPMSPPTTTKLYGWVNDSYGPVNSATVRVTLFDARYENSTTTDIDGYYEMWVPPYALDITCSAYDHSPEFTSIDTSGSITEYRLDFDLGDDTTAPDVTWSIDPTTNVSYMNPLFMDATVVEDNLKQLFFWTVTEYETGPSFTNYTIVALSQSLNDPFYWDDDTLNYYDSGASWIVNGMYLPVNSDMGVLSDGVYDAYLMAQHNNWNMTDYYAFQGYYSNATLVDLQGFMLFDQVTHEPAWFLPDSWTGESPIESPVEGTFAPLTWVVQFPSTGGDWPSAMNWFALDEFSVADLALTMDSLAPSGNYKAMFWVSDWADHILSFAENFTVDNDEPVADAGPDFTAVVNTTITLDASASHDNVGIVDYTWSYTDPDGATVYLYGETVETLIWETGSYEFTLMVEDGASLIGFDYVTAEVTPDAPPVADAGPDMTVDEDTDFAFDGSASYDDVGIDNYTWYVVELDVHLYGEMPGFNIADSGVYTVELIVMDTLGQVSAPYVLSLTVLDITAPTADAGLDQTVDMGAVVQFNGTGSSDNVGVVNYTWTFTDGAGVTLYGVGPTYQFDNAGEFVVTLTVADGEGLTATDTMTVTVIDTEAPVANAGADQTVDMGATVTLNASLSSDNVGIADYVWTFTYDGTEETLTGMVQSYAFELPGVYTVTLNVTDAAGNYATDTVVITVNDTELPVADAGADIDAIAGEEVTFDGTGSSDNVGIAAYSWAFIDSTSQVLHTATPSYTFETAGEYIVTLTVTDEDGNIDTDTVTVRVAASNEAPVADAGIDQTASAGDTVTFDGAGSTDDVEVTNYTWTFTYDGSTVTLYGAAPTFVFDVAGTYTVTLTVTDADDLSDTDTVEITVQESSKTFIESYWWLLVVVAVVVVAGVVFLLMGKGKGRTPSKVDEDEDAENEPPAPPEDEGL